ncbi:TetR/AcrR family transcriptional regulator [Hymenobacter sp. RP-2-7]|uniref:TetR/AcrR family transcriptional regulator n=1 Tax=Hymenobacter polaris TaxID=2682546 RepID=A0A7Y0ADD3_9BACT|nr:TetR/AcrR family transcriptional regulator [Hymenobacter polaris]NML65257.1 TetR/AcrR family transcriptional regulator [Hymenobacter polaris]
MVKPKKSGKRELILAEAAKLFKDRGYSGTSMRDLAGQVGMEAASMYNHIKSKDELLDTICFRISDTYISQLAEIEATPSGYADKLRALVRLHIRLMVEDGAAVSVANHDWKYLPEPRLGEFKQARKAYERGFAALIEAGIAAGELRPVNVSVALFTMLSAVRWVELWYRPGRGISAEELESNIITVLLGGLEQPMPQP